MVIHGAASMTVVWTMLLLWPGRCDASMVCPICLSMLVSLILYACFYDTSMGHYHYGKRGTCNELSLSLCDCCLPFPCMHAQIISPKAHPIEACTCQKAYRVCQEFSGLHIWVLSILLVVVRMVPCCGNSFCYISNLMVVMLTCYESLLHTDIGCLTDA
jgi:hypothetical protein